MDNICVSVIIPVYNSDKFLDRCLNSVSSQTLKNYEVIIVNDGSTDKSSQIIDDYCKKYDNFVVVNQKNRGVSYSRNVAIKMARGEYISFVDSDDFVEPQFLELMYKNANSDNSDIVCCGYYIKNGNSRNKHITFVKPGVYKNPKILKHLIYDTSVHYYIWDKMFRRSLITDNDISFPDMCFEDVNFTVQCFFFANQVTIIPSKLYTYVKHNESLVSSLSEKKIHEYIYTLHDTRGFLEAQNAFAIYKKTFTIHSMRTFFLSLCMLCTLYFSNRSYKGFIFDLKHILKETCFCNSSKFVLRDKEAFLCDKNINDDKSRSS